MHKSHRKIAAVGVLACALSGFGLGLLEMPREAEAALLPNNPGEVVITPDLAVYSPEQKAATPEMSAIEPVKLYTQADVEMLARLIYTEARGVESQTEQAAVVWVVLNRLDNPDRGHKSIAEVVCAPYQFDYRPWVPVTDEFKALAADVLERWQAEKQVAEDVGRTLPEEYQYFEGDGERNYFSAEWKSDEYWDWSLPTPYED